MASIALLSDGHSDLERGRDLTDLVQERDRKGGLVATIRTRQAEGESLFEDSGTGPLGPNLTVNRKAIQRSLVLKSLQQEEPKILKEREALVEKEIAGDISEQEARRLKYLRWQLDQLDDARIGESLDKLESIVRAQEQFNDRLEQYSDSIKIAIKESGNAERERSRPRKARKGKRR